MISTDSKEYLIRTAFQRFGETFLEAHPNIEMEKFKALRLVSMCKTGELGYNTSVCEECGHQVIHAVSCNNRACPCCQAPLAGKWEHERNTELIEGISYFHVVFTMPHELNDLIRHNKVLLLNLLFKCVQETLLTLCADKRYMGAKPGIISVLHTWGQTLSFHPHIHVCISGGGITSTGQFVETRHKGFFLPKETLAKMFRGKYLCSLKSLYDKGKMDLSHTENLKDLKEWKNFIDSLFDKPWIPFVKETFNGRGNAIRYLARYSYRTAISNSRIVSVGENTVTFRYKDYADNNAEKLMTKDGPDFIGLYLQHILPPGFHRFRFSGYLSNCNKSKNLKLIHGLRSSVYGGNPYRKMKMAELLQALYGRDICRCPECSGKMIALPRGMPLSTLPSLSNDMPLAMC